ncbi:MAG TPA: guanine deaminase [Candidatus Competibacteraceae bacterium]|nr:guanine deaminase [Candidatus Competibacteraceae bacterium]
MSLAYSASPLKAFRGRIVHCLRDPGTGNDAAALEHFEDGLLVVEHGRVARVGPAAELLPQLAAGTPLEDHRGKLIVPGFIDTHIHYPQTDIIASYGEQLLTWLERYTFPTEGQFQDAAHAAEVAEFFLGELLRNGTTSALVLATVHPQSVDAIFAAAQARGMRLIAGKVLMDRNCPEFLRDSAETGYTESKALIERWHGVERLAYAITPRFAPTSSERQLELAGQLGREHPDVYLHTHVAENRAEVAWVAKLFPWSRSYLDVYDRFGLLRDRAVYAHCIHLDEQDRRRMAESGAVAAFCPTSNLFLGSGLFDLEATRGLGVRVGLATDVGGGTSFSMIRTLAEAYKVEQLAGQALSPARALYLATLGSAEALYLEDRIGNFLPGKEADFVVLNPGPTPLMARRMAHTHTLEEQLFALFTLGDDRNVAVTYVMGEAAYRAG